MCATTGGTFYLSVEKDLGHERFLTDDPSTLFSSGNFSRVPMIIGRTSEEEGITAEGMKDSPKIIGFELCSSTTFSVSALEQPKTYRFEQGFR